MILVERKDEFIDLLFGYVKHVVNGLNDGKEISIEEIRILPEIVSHLKSCLTLPTNWVLSSKVCKGNFYATFVNRSKYNK